MDSSLDSFFTCFYSFPLSIRDLPSLDYTWNIPFMLSIFDSSSIREILKLKVGPPFLPNFIWPLSTNGLFSTRSAFNQITFPRVNSAFSPLNPLAWKKLWKLQLNDRLKLFLWKIAWDIIPTKSRLNHFLNLSPSDLLCPFCKFEVDFVSHIFFRCFFSRVAWKTFFWPLDSLVWDNLSPSQWIEGILFPTLLLVFPWLSLTYFRFLLVFCVILCGLTETKLFMMV